MVHVISLFEILMRRFLSFLPLHPFPLLVFLFAFALSPFLACCCFVVVVLLCCVIFLKTTQNVTKRKEEMVAGSKRVLDKD